MLEGIDTIKNVSNKSLRYKFILAKTKKFQENIMSLLRDIIVLITLRIHALLENFVLCGFLTVFGVVF